MDPLDVKEKHAANREAWNEAAVKYSDNIAEAISFIKSGSSSIHPIERKNLGCLRDWCHTAIHLMCASGQDTLSLLNEGVEQVIGIDISDRQIENAQALAEAVGSAATFYRCDVLDSPEELNGTADLVYTGRGALCWIHDIANFARVAARLLKVGGIFHIYDDHPLTWLLCQDRSELNFADLNYFHGTISEKGWPPQFIGDLGKSAEDLCIKYERVWPVSAVIQALIDVGFMIEYFGEHSDEYWNQFPLLSAEQKKKFPLTFSVKARKGNIC